MKLIHPNTIHLGTLTPSLSGFEQVHAAALDRFHSYLELHLQRGGVVQGLEDGKWLRSGDSACVHTPCLLFYFPQKH